jgi:tRNA(Ile)-lysidine synthase
LTHRHRLALRAALELHTPVAATGLVVALSGGADSACLLAALVEERFRNLSVRAVHVDHGLQPAAGAFRRACEALCGRLGVALAVIEVRVEASVGLSLEAAARDARYAGLARQLRDGECLLTAHHAEDQAETVLLQLLRGAGLKGLCAMPPCRVFGCGWHLRPLLDITQRELLRFGATSRLATQTDPMNDPMNEDLRFDRNYLRRRVWPLIAARWPGAAPTLSRTARHLADAQELLDESASRTLTGLRDGTSLSVTGLRALSAPERRNVVRHFIAAHRLEPPSSARLDEALRQILAARSDHQPAVVWGDRALRRYRDRLFLTAARPPHIGEARAWRATLQPTLHLGPGLGSIRFLPQAEGLAAERLPDTLTVRQRRGGETLKPLRRAGTRSLTHLCQSVGLLPWMRDALPLIYAGDDLIAVADLWQDARWCVANGAPGLGIEWREAPELL